MSTRARRFRVTVIKPRPKDGPCWLFLIRPPHGNGTPKKKTTGTEDRAEAEELARELEQRLNRAIIDPTDTNPLVLEVFDRHLAFRDADPLTAPNTRIAYHTQRARLAVAFDGVRASEVTRAVVLRAQQLLLQTLAPATVNLAIGCAAHAWTWALDNEQPGVRNPWPKVKALRVERTAKRHYTPDELERVFQQARAYAGGRYVALFCLLAENGARISEVCSLQGRHVDRAASVLRFEKTKTRAKREVKVSPEVMSMIPDRVPAAFVFPAVLDPRRPLDPKTVGGALRIILKRAGLRGEPLDLHSFRRYVVRKLHDAHVPLRDAMDFVGHRSVSTHLSYMAGAASSRQEELLASAREVHDVVRAAAACETGAVPPRGPSRVEVESCRKPSSIRLSASSGPSTWASTCIR